MEYVRLGNTGLKVSRICLGTMTYGTPEWRPWVLDEVESRPFFKRALEQRHQLLRHRRHVLARRQRRGHRPRAEGVRAARPGRDRHQGLLPDRRRPERARACRASTSWTRSTRSLRRLGTDYVDLYQIHRFDSETPIEETLEALHDIVKAGKARYIGASSMYAWQFAKMLYVADRHGWTRFVSMQNHYNLVYREEEREMLPLCREEGHRRDPVEPAGARLPRRQPPQGRLRRHRPRQDRRLRAQLYYTDADFAVADRVVRTGRAPRREADADRARLAAVASRASPRRSSAHRSSRTSTRRSPRPRHHPVARGDGVRRRALPAAPSCLAC